MPAKELKGVTYQYDADPDHCPICHHGIEPTMISGNVLKFDSQRQMVELIYRCPRLAVCGHAFIARYLQDQSGSVAGPQGLYRLRAALPWAPVPATIPDEVSALSPNYKTLMTQSSAAEQFKLDQIVGAGYRKALEFLVKDYAIHQNAAKAEEIKSAFLGVVIESYVADANVKKCAKLATWLGNDESHYVRKWEEKDIRDLKALIKLTETWILNSVLTEKYVKDMSPDATGNPPTAKQS